MGGVGQHHRGANGVTAEEQEVSPSQVEDIEGKMFLRMWKPRSPSTTKFPASPTGAMTRVSECRIIVSL